MGVDAGVASSTRQVLVLAVWNVEVGLRITVLLREAKVDDVDLVTTLTNAHQEVVRLDVTVNEGLGVDVLNAGDELVGEEENRLQRELAIAEVEEVFEAGSKKVEDHGIVVALCTEPPNKGNADATGEGLVDAGLVFELRVLGLDALELDSNFFAGDDVST